MADENDVGAKAEEVFKAFTAFCEYARQMSAISSKEGVVSYLERCKATMERMAPLADTVLASLPEHDLPPITGELDMKIDLDMLK